MRRMLALFAAVGLIGCLTAAPARAAAADVHGTVLDPAGEPLEGVSVMLIEGERRVPPFLVRPQALGLPLRQVRTAETDADGRFELSHVGEGPKTLLLGEEGLLLFGVAGSRSVAPGPDPVTVRFSEREMEELLTIGDRAERAHEVVEDVVIEAGIALSWYIDARRRAEDARADARDRLDEARESVRARLEEAREALRSRFGR